MRIVWIVVGIVLASLVPLVALLACLIFLISYYARSADLDLKRLIAGDDELEITSLTIKGQCQGITLSDPAVMAYLTRSFRGALREGLVPSHESGYAYYAHMQLSNGHVLMVGCDVPPDADGWTIGYYPHDSFDDPTFYWMPFVRPMPATIAATIAKMRKGIGDKKGKEKDKRYDDTKIGTKR